MRLSGFCGSDINGIRTVNFTAGHKPDIILPSNYGRFVGKIVQTPDISGNIHKVLYPALATKIMSTFEQFL